MMMQEALPGIKRFLKVAKLDDYTRDFLVRLVAAFLCHVGRMSASAAAGAIRTQARHRAAVTRFLAQLGYGRDWSLLERLAELVLEAESRPGGLWVFIVDQTLIGHQGKKTENTFSTGNRQRRRRKGRRYNRYRYARKSCHCLVMGLLLTPSGLRLPCWKSYYTKAYCQAKGWTYRTQTDLASDLIREVVVPEGAEVVVVGDTAFDAKNIRAACGARGFTWIVPVNPERVLAGPKGHRPKVRSLIAGLSAGAFSPIRLTPGEGEFVAQRRIAPCRLGPKAKTRTFHVHRERRQVHSVGDVQLVFSTKEKPQEGQSIAEPKILMTNDPRRATAEIVELYDLRWQIELFFKELKSTLGLHQYQFGSFAKVEAWVAVCLIAFVYLEWYRASRLRNRRNSAKAKRAWVGQRTHGLCLLVRQEAEASELTRLADWTRTPAGLKKLKKQLRAARPLEYRKVG